MSSDPPEPNSQGVRFSKQYTVASTTDSTACILDSVPVSYTHLTLPTSDLV